MESPVPEPHQTGETPAEPASSGTVVTTKEKDELIGMGPLVGWALLGGVVVLVITILAGWRAGLPADYTSVRQQGNFHVLDMLIGIYRNEAGHLPDSLQELTKHPSVAPYNGLDLRDAWGQPHLYEKKGDDFELTSLGADGQVGGRGLDADYHFPRHADEDHRLTLKQYLISVYQHNGVIFLVLPSILTFGMLLASGHKKPNKRAVREMLSAFFVTGVASVVMCLFMAALSSSGH